MGLFDLFKKNEAKSLAEEYKEYKEYKCGSFSFTIDDIFTIKGRGVVVTGRIESGTIHKDDTVIIHTQKGTIQSTITGIEMFRQGLITSASEGDNVGLLLSGIDSTDVKPGDRVTSSP